MNRRQFLGASAASALAGLVGGTRWASAKVAVNLEALAQPDLVSLLGPHAVRKIGLRYRAFVPTENDARALYAAILAARPWPPSIAALVEQDFAIGRTMVLQGWVVSVTEARQSALFSLLAD
jgi:hypothetical protein